MCSAHFSSFTYWSNIEEWRKRSSKCFVLFSKHMCIDIGLKGVLGDSHLKSNLLGIKAETHWIQIWQDHKKVTYLAASTPSQVVLSLIKILSLLIPSSSYNLINRLAFSIEPSTSKDNLQAKLTRNERSCYH